MEHAFDVFWHGIPIQSLEYAGFKPTFIQGSRLTFQLASPVASDRFYSLAKTNFSLARSSTDIHDRIKSSKW